MDFVTEWRNHSMGSNGRENLNESDSNWNEEYEIVSNSFVPKGTLLYRVHSGGYREPKFEHYGDHGDRQEEVFEEEHKNWEDSQKMDKIRWHNHWVSFTKSPDVIGSDYFDGKKLRGFVIVVKSEKALDISWKHRRGFNEYEVVAPMDQSTCVEILEFDNFMNKYGTGNSYYEKESMKQRK